MSKDLYYCNKPCTLLHKMENESLIEILSEEAGYFGGDYEPDYTEPVFNTIIVDNKYLSESKVDYAEEFNKRAKKEDDLMKVKHIEHCENMFKKTQIIDKFSKRVERIENLDTALKMLEGDMDLWALTTSYTPELKAIKDFTYNEGYGVRQRQRALVFKLDEGEVKCYISRYGDGSGLGDRCELFNTYEEGKDALINIIKRDSNKDKYINVCDKHGIKDEGVGKAKKERDDKIHAQKQKEKNALLKKLENMEVKS